jgi:hypothetical protein
LLKQNPEAKGRVIETIDRITQQLKGKDA